LKALFPQLRSEITDKAKNKEIYQFAFEFGKTERHLCTQFHASLSLLFALEALAVIITLSDKIRLWAFSRSSGGGC
jgi:hypothetical protein